MPFILSAVSTQKYVYVCVYEYYETINSKCTTLNKIAGILTNIIKLRIKLSQCLNN
jgi:hypothetical protein